MRGRHGHSNQVSVVHTLEEFKGRVVRSVPGMTVYRDCSRTKEYEKASAPKTPSEQERWTKAAWLP